VATPIIQSTGSVSGAGTAGQGRNDLVPGETVTLSDTEPLNLGATYFWVFDDTPIGTSPTLLNHTTATPSFVADADAEKAGSYRVRCTVNGTFVSVEVLAVPLENTGARIPSFEEETQYDKAGNLKGWHEAMTVFMRSVDQILGDLGATAFSLTAAAVVPNGTNSVELELGAVVYPGSLLALGIRGEAAVTGGAVNVSARINGITKFTATMNLGSPNSAFSVQLPGTYPVVQGDRLSVTVAGAALVTAGATPLPVSVSLVSSNTLATDIVSFPDASNVQKGITKLSVAPAIPTEPVAAGTNDNRIPTQSENDALVGTAGAPGAGNTYVTDSDTRNTNARVPTAHSLSGSEHTAVTLAAFNAKISDTDAVDTLDTRIPVQDENDALQGTNGTPSNSNRYVTNTDPRIPVQDENDALQGTNGTPNNANRYVTNTDPRNTDARTPSAHTIGGATHTADTFTNFKTKITGAVPAAVDLSQQFSNNQRSAVVALTDAANIATSVDLGNIFEVTLGGNRTLDNPTGLVKGMSWVVMVHQDGTGGRTLAFGSQYDWGDEGAPSFAGQAANKTNLLSFFAISTTQIAGSALKGFV
jgi:hypothetical protein